MPIQCLIVSACHLLYIFHEGSKISLTSISLYHLIRLTGGDEPAALLTCTRSEAGFHNDNVLFDILRALLIQSFRLEPSSASSISLYERLHKQVLQFLVASSRMPLTISPILRFTNGVSDFLFLSHFHFELHLRTIVPSIHHLFVLVQVLRHHQLCSLHLQGFQLL